MTATIAWQDRCELLEGQLRRADARVVELLSEVTALTAGSKRLAVERDAAVAESTYRIEAETKAAKERDEAMGSLAEVERKREEMRDEIERWKGRSAAMSESLRPVLWAFALRMEAALRRNEHKGGWQSDRPEVLFRRLLEEVEELSEPLRQGIKGNDCVAEEAADVANFAMMLADNSGRLAPFDAPDVGKALLAERDALRGALTHIHAMASDKPSIGAAMACAALALEALKETP